MGLVPTTVNGPGLGRCASVAIVIRCPSLTRWRSYAIIRIELVRGVLSGLTLVQREETRQGEATRPALGCTSTPGGDPVHALLHAASACRVLCRSEERRVGKECR